MDNDFYENGAYKGRKDSEGRVFNERGDLIGIDNKDGTYIDFRTGNLWRKEERFRFGWYIWSMLSKMKKIQ